MQDRIDPLIAERAPWLFGGSHVAHAARRALMRALGYRQTLELAELYRDWPADQIMRHLGTLLAGELCETGLDNIPRHGPALVVANHPTGIADGVMLHHALSKVRADTFIYANADILRVLPQLSCKIAPVEWRVEKRTHRKARETMAYTRGALSEGRIGVIFPSGRLAKRRGLTLQERDWMTSAAMIARKFDVPIIPVNIQARNSILFYLFDLLHPTLRDITLFHETLNKGHQPYRLTIGEPIAPHVLPTSSDAATQILKRVTLMQAKSKKPQGSRTQNTRRLIWAR